MDQTALGRLHMILGQGIGNVSKSNKVLRPLKWLGIKGHCTYQLGMRDRGGDTRVIVPIPFQQLWTGIISPDNIALRDLEDQK